MRKPLIAGNWKMFKSIGETVSTITSLKPLVKNVEHCDIVVAPPFTTLSTASEKLESSNIGLSAQNLSSEIKYGAHTGEICGDMLVDAGCSYAIVGHSERRAMYGDTDEIVNRKIKAALHFKLTPIFCLGETLDERDGGREEKVVDYQLSEGLNELTAEDLMRIIIAYEPVWAIGTGRTATPAQAQQMHAFIRHQITKLFGQQSGDNLRILYGGSVKPENISDLMNESDIDGALVGGASLDAESFARIVNYNR